MTFSSGIRKELAERHREHAQDIDWSLASFATFSAVLGKVKEAEGGWRVTLRVAGSYTVTLLETIAKTLSLPLRRIKTGRRDVTVAIFVPISKRLALFFDFDHWCKETGETGLEPVFAAFFLACGVMSDPVTGRYRLAFSPSSASAVSLMMHIFDKSGLAVKQTQHQGKTHLILSSGEEVSRFLLLCGAHNALLEFEEKRSERELIGQVNRQVNFDDANAGRRADSIASQLEAIEVIERYRGIDTLPPPLVEAARARLTNRGASLEELGAAMVPPVSKSGMSHRLNKIRLIAYSLLGSE